MFARKEEKNLATSSRGEEEVASKGGQENDQWALGRSQLIPMLPSAYIRARSDFENATL